MRIELVTSDRIAIEGDFILHIYRACRRLKRLFKKKPIRPIRGLTFVEIDAVVKEYCVPEGMIDDYWKSSFLIEYMLRENDTQRSPSKSVSQD